MENSLDNLLHSPWNRSPFLELEQNIQALVSLTQGRGGEEEDEEEEGSQIFTQRAVAYYRKKAELKKRVRCLHKHYSSMLSKLHHLPSPNSTPQDSTVEDANFLKEYEISRLLDDCGEHLNELSRRNREKKEAIRELKRRVERLEQENQKLRGENEAALLVKREEDQEKKECSITISKGSSSRRPKIWQFSRLKKLMLGSVLGKNSN